MRVLIVTPASLTSTLGNSVTARRWAGLIESLGHRVEILATYEGQDCDLLLALHARRSHDSILRYRQERGAAPLIVALTGTDLYRDLPGSAEALESLQLGDRLVVLQKQALEALPEAVRAKGRVTNKLFRNSSMNRPHIFYYQRKVKK